jgi:predicted metal-dependent hydrolase
LIAAPSPRDHCSAVKSLGTESLALPGGSATILWRRSKRARRIILRIDAQLGHVIVTLPMRTARSAGVALLRQNADWVATRLAELPQAAPLADGGSVAIDGIPHSIRHMPGRRGGAWIEDGAVHVTGEPEFLARRLRDFLRAEARRRLSGRALAKAAEAGLAVRRVSVRDTRSRWGSCSGDGVLMFCWRLLMAPTYVQDYVVAHEVAHLRHMNHGQDFWALADLLSPHRALAVAWLDQEGARLLRVG